MKITLLSFTPDALNLLLRTKNTRMKYEEDPAGWPMEKKMEHLDYMRHTIKSSLEFVNYLFQIEGVSRAFTHEFVRTRHASFAQQSMRVIDASGNGVYTSEALCNGDRDLYEATAEHAVDAYAALLRRGVAPADARGILPTNILTSIIAGFNLRALHDTARLRLCTRAAGEYQEVFRAMKAAVVAVHPWAEPFIRVACAQDGVCQFPNFTECPIQPLTYNSQFTRAEHEKRLSAIQIEWETNRYEAKPRAHEGMAK